MISNRFLFTLVSGNKKTGPIPVITSNKATCPDACPLKKSGCYAASGALSIHWTRLSNGETGGTWADLVKSVKKLHFGQLFRYGQAGDLPGENNRIDAKALGELVSAAKGKHVIAYSHKPVLNGQADKTTVESNRNAIRAANEKGFAINLSGNNLKHADELIKLNIGPVVTLLPEGQKSNCKTPDGNRVIVCPATIKDGVTCANCKLCSWNTRKYIIGFPAHGNARKIVSQIAKG